MPVRKCATGKTSVAWPHWMLRFVAANGDDALSDLVASLAADPPWGRVSGSEVEAVRSLVEAHQYESTIPDQVFQRALSVVRDSPEKVGALEVFRLHDRIAGSPENVTVKDAAQGLEMAERLSHDGLRARFLGIQADAEYRAGDVRNAHRSSASAFDLFRSLAANDTAYLSNFRKTGTNTVTFALMEGDFETARRIRNEVAAQVGPTAAAALAIPERPSFPSDLTLVSKTASNYLESGDPLRALEWFREAVRLAKSSGEEAQLCGILGDMAVAFRRLGNTPQAFQTYEEAIQLSRKYSDWVNLSRWCQNIGLLLLERNDIDRAAIYLKEALRAASLSKVAYQISTAAGNYTALLARQQRFAEAMESLDQAAAVAGEDPSLAPLWQSQRVAVLIGWGQQLRDEFQADRALDVFRKAVNAANLDDPEQKKAVAFAWVCIAELQERAGQVEEARSSIGHAVSLYRDLGEDEEAEKLEAVGREFTHRPRTTNNRESAGLDSAALEQQVREAVARSDVQAEATSRLKFVAALRLSGDSRTAAEFENAMALVRRLRDRRRELILCLNFAPYFLEKGEVTRAAALSERGVNLAKASDPGSMIYALANRAEVRMKGMNETGEALADFQKCSELLQAYIEQNPEDRELPNNVSRALLEGSQLAAKSGNTDLALTIGAVVDPKIAALLEQSRSKRKQATPPTPDIAALRMLREPELDRVLAAWHAGGPVQTPPPDPILARLAEASTVLGWQWAAQRLSHPPLPDRAESSNPGAAGLLQLAEMVVEGTITLEVAITTARKLAVPDDDLDCIGIFVLNDKRRASKGVSFTAWKMIAAIASAPCRSRCYNLLGMYSSARDPEGALAYYRLGAQALDGTELKPERAHLLNEAGALLAGPLRRFDESLPLSKLALTLAEETGRKDIAANAMGNLALALLNLDRAEEAVELFERLAKLQQEINDTRGLENTRFNLKLAYLKLGKSERMQFDAASDDLDTVFARASELGLEYRYQEAIREFERGLSIIAERNVPYAGEGQVRMNFARTLFSAGETERSVAQMKEAALRLEAGHHTRDLHDALTWLASIRVEDEVEGLRYAQRALELSRKLGPDEAVAVDLTQLAQNRIAARRSEEAVGPLEEAITLSKRSDIRSTLAQALVGVGRIAEARRIYEELLSAIEEPLQKASLLIGLSEVLEKSGDDKGALERLVVARELTAGSESREAAFVANHLGLALLKRGRLEEAAATLEDGIGRARALGLWRLELSLLSNFGGALKELGDLDGAEAALVQAREGCRTRGMRDSEAIALASLGNVSMDRRDPEAALARFQEAADLAHGIDAATEATCVDSLGMLYSQLGKPERAVEYHRRAADLHGPLHAWDSLLVDLINVGQTYLVLGEENAAADCLNKAQQLVREHNLSNWGLSFLAGLVAASERRWAEARRHFREAIETVEAIRGSLSTPEAQRKWAAGKAKIYGFAVEKALQAGDGEAAAEFIECSRARYLKAILERRTHQPPGVDDETWLRYERAADRQAQVRARRRSQIASGRPPEEHELQEIDVEFKKAIASIEAQADAGAAAVGFKFPVFADLIARIPARHAAVWMGTYGRSLGFVYAGRDVEGKTWSAAELAPDGLAADLDTLIFGNSATIDLARRQHTALEEVPVEEVGFRLAGYFLGQSEVLREVALRTYGFQVSDPDRLFRRSLDHTCRWLGARLWPIIESRLPKGTKVIVLLPSAALNLLPLHAAVRASGSRIDESYRIRYLPSLAMAREAQAATGPHRLGQVVNPSEDAGLAFSSVEATGVAQSLAGAAVSRLDGEKATATNVLSLLLGSDIFHFVGHAFYNAADPFHSGLTCAGRREEDQVLTLAAVLQRVRSIQSQLVVLSACETGQVEPDDELDDFLGLPGAFLVAGAETIVASLWRVDDLAACLLIDKYFEIWNGGRVDVAEALAAAQKWLRSEVSVGYVVGKLKEWRERLTESNEVFEAAFWDLVSRSDQDSRAFPGESSWAAFYVTGMPLAA